MFDLRFNYYYPKGQWDVYWVNGSLKYYYTGYWIRKVNNLYVLSRYICVRGRFQTVEAALGEIFLRGS